MFLFLLSVIALSLAVPAMADVIWEPYDDEFYWEHYDECLYADADYEALTEVTVYESPASQAEAGVIAAGETVYIGYTWTSAGGTLWGYAVTSSNGTPWGAEETDISGWVCLDQMARLYDAACFLEEYGEEFVELADTQTLETDADVVYLWTFPGSGVVSEALSLGSGWMADDPPSYYILWTDEEGGQWAQIIYYYGAKGWIYLSDPGAAGLPVTAPRYADGTGDAALPDAADAGTAFPVLPVVLAAAVVILAAAALVFLLKQKKRP